MTFPKIIFTSLAFLVGILLVSSGTLGLANTLHFARTVFAIPSATEETIAFYPGLAGRNIGAGLAVLSLMLSGQRKATGMLLLCWTSAGFSDTYLLLIREDGENIPFHVFNIVWISLTAAGLMMG